MKSLIISLCLLLVYSLALAENPDPTKFEPQYYENAKVLRVKYTTGEAYVQRSYDEGLESATLNLPVFEKDKAGTTTGRIEFYLGRLNYLRLDQDTEVIFSEIPSLGKTNLNLRIIKGGIYLDVGQIENEKDIEIQTPDCGVFILDRGMYRINVNESGYTEVFAFEGIAEVAGDDYSRNVRTNQKTVMSNGIVRERPFYFSDSERDDFDTWNEQRNRTIGYSRQSASRYLESGYEDAEYELSHSGRWVYEPEYTTYVWIPYHIGSTWRPYWNGRWIWNPYYGYVWNSYDPWGWYTHYYGRWHWSQFYGWYWIPGYHWSPAWVSWYWGHSYYGWCPLSYWNRPMIVLNKRWLKNYHYWKGLPAHASSSIIIKKNQLSASNISKIAMKRSEISRTTLRTLDFRGQAPQERLRDSRVNVVDARGRTVQYKQNALSSSSGSRTINKNGYKYSSGINSSGQPFKSSRSAVKTESKFRSLTSGSNTQGRGPSGERKVYRSSSKSPTTWRGTPTRKYSSPPAKRSSSGKKATSGKRTTTSKRKKDQPYYQSRSTTASSTSRYRSSSSYREPAGKTTTAGNSATSSSAVSRFSSPKTYRTYQSHNPVIRDNRSVSGNSRSAYAGQNTPQLKVYRSSRTSPSSKSVFRTGSSPVFRSTRSTGYPSIPYRNDSRTSGRTYSSRSITGPSGSSWNTSRTRIPYQTSRSAGYSSSTMRRSSGSPPRSTVSASRSSASRSHASSRSSSSGSSARKKD